MSIPEKYVPKTLSKKDAKKQKEQILKSREGYKEGEFLKREKVKSAKVKPSPWNEKLKDILKIKTISKPKIAEILSKGNEERKKQIKKGLDKIYDKGKGAYYSAGSRPNVNEYQWATARLSSVLLGGPAREIDKDIIEKYKVPLVKR